MSTRVPEPAQRPRIAAFPKGFFEELIVRERLTIDDFVRRAPAMGLEGVELYPLFLKSYDDREISRLKSVGEDVNVALPMMCSSPDFTDPMPGAWERAVSQMHELVDVMAAITPAGDWRSVRVLSGQAWPQVTEEEGLARAIEGIEQVVAYAAPRGVFVIMENHYKDGLWNYPEFAQSSERYLKILNAIDSPWFGASFDPSNAITAGEEPLDLLEVIAERVRAVGASDRSLRPGYTLDDLRGHKGGGYPQALQHGVVGQGLNDYPAILSRLAGVGFAGWISIEDGEAGGEQGFADIASSAMYLREQIRRFWPMASLDEETP